MDVCLQVIALWKGERAAYGQPCDMWSVGVVTFTLLSGYQPFYARTDEKILEKVQRAEYDFCPEKIWSPITTDAKDFVAKLLVLDPKDRMTAQVMNLSATENVTDRDR